MPNPEFNHDLKELLRVFLLHEVRFAHFPHTLP